MLLGSVLYAKWQTLLHSDSNAFNVKIQVEERQIQINSECNGVQKKKKLPVDMKIVEELMIHIQIYLHPPTRILNDLMSKDTKKLEL